MAVTAWVGWRLRTAPGNRRAASVTAPFSEGDSSGSKYSQLLWVKVGTIRVPCRP